MAVSPPSSVPSPVPAADQAAPAPGRAVRPASGVRLAAGPPAGGRRWVAVAVCAVVAVLAALAAVAVVQQTGERSPVLALARDVPMGQQITEQDLVIAQAAADPALAPVAASDLDRVVGLYAATRLHAGSLLTGAMLAEDNRLDAGQRLIGVELRKSRMPLDVLQAGDRVLVVHTNAQADEDGDGGGSSRSEVEATVRAIGEPDTSGARMVNLAVAAGDAAALAAWAAAGDVMLVLEPEN